MKTEEIEAEQQAPTTVPEPERPLSPLARGGLVSAVTGALVLGGILLVPPSSSERGAAPLRGPPAARRPRRPRGPPRRCPT
ncbi:hypothetical protein ACFQ0Q_17030 [Streptomyces aureus]